MLQRSFKPAKCKTSLKFATSRIKVMKNKKENHLKQLKMELAQLLESGQDQTARIRVEHVVREEKMIAAYDLLDIYCELIVARLPIIESQKTCPIDMKEAVTSVIFASPRCSDIPELQDVRKQFTAKYGKEFVNAALELRPECGASRMLVEKLSATAPDGQTKLKILSAIAEEHNIKWDPKSFGQKESKPYDDLLNGPNRFDNANKTHSEPPIVQPPPNVYAPQSHDQKHNAPANYQQNLQSSTSTNNFASSDFNDGQSRTSAAPQPHVRPPGTEYDRTEVRHSHSRHENAFSSSGQNWNMEFKDATAAAQAAAESAERASMAARAAAELSRQHSHESRKSDDKPQRNENSLSEEFTKGAGYSFSQDRRQNPHVRAESHYDSDDRFVNDDHGTTKRLSQSASSGSGAASIKDNRPMNKFHEGGQSSQKSSNEEDWVKSQKRASLSGMGVNKQATEQDSNYHSRSSSSSDGKDRNSPSSPQNFVFDDSKDSLDSINRGNSLIGSGNISSADVVFDSYASDPDELHFDSQPHYDDQESTHSPTSLSKEPSDCLAVGIDKGSYTSVPSDNFFPEPNISSEWFSPPKSDPTIEKTPSSAQQDDLAPATFDDSRGPSSDSEDEPEKSSFHEKNDPDMHPSPQSSMRSSVYEVKDTDGPFTSPSTGTLKSEGSYNQSRYENGNELNLGSLTGGLRNKGYKLPPYTKRQSGNSTSSKVAVDDSLTFTRNPPASLRTENSTSSSGSGPKLEENSSGRTRIKNYDVGKEDFEDEPPEHNLQNKQEPYIPKEKTSSRTQIKNYDLGTDDFEEEVPQQKLRTSIVKERKEDNTRSKFSAPVGYFDSDDDDLEADLPKQTSTSKVHAGSKFSRRTKANPISETSSHPKTRRGSSGSVSTISSPQEKADVPENKPISRPDSGKHSKSRPVQKEKQKSSTTEQPSPPLETVSSLSTETSRTSSTDAPSRESSLKKASHVHPKLPDYDSIAAQLESLRQNRR